MFNPFIIEQELPLYARRLCSGVFLCDRDPGEIFEYSGPPSWAKPEISFAIDDHERRVAVTYRGVTRVAQFVGDQGSVVLPKDGTGISFEPVEVVSALPFAAAQEWPMGDMPSGPRSTIDREQVREALDLAFDHPRNMTAAVVVVHQGEIVGERYRAGVMRDTQLESWSMGKSLLATVFARLLFDGTFELDERDLVPEWRAPGDRRREIRVRDLLQMSSGLKCSFSFDGDHRFESGYPDHMLGYTEAIDVHSFARSMPLESPVPKPKGRYRNCDPWVLGSLLKDAVRERGEEYLLFAQRALFDRIGIRRQVLEADPAGNLIYTGCDYGTARNWARLGLLYLHEGRWNGEQILPEYWTKFVNTPADAWERPEYGGLFWLNGAGGFPMLPRSTYYAAGAGAQYTIVIPEYDMVVVRMGHLPEFSALLPTPAVGSDPGIGPAPSTLRMLEKLKCAVAGG